MVLVPVLSRVSILFHALRRQTVLSRRFAGADLRFQALRDHWSRGPKPSQRLTRRLSELSPELERIIATKRQHGLYVPLALIDRNGPLLPLIEPFWATKVIPAVEFRPAHRHSLVIIDLEGNVGILKNFLGNVSEFVNELEAALMLHEGRCNVPDVLHVDFDHLHIVYSYVRGRNLRLLLEEAGADVRGLPMPRFILSRRRLEARRIELARQLLPHVIDAATIDRIRDGLVAVHRAGCTLEDIKYGNIIIEEKTGEPIFIDFERALCLKDIPPGLASYIRERDIKKLTWILRADPAIAPNRCLR
ncbi:MAG: hypothetical protein K0S56_639 [Microvirga sp.]|jgi:serine/threonine protein kinase|nr:hypothetical protein [Microvirga sp.]